MSSTKAKAIISSVVGLALLVCLSVPVYPDDDLDKKLKELEEINQTIDKYEKLYDQKQKEERKVLGDIRSLEKNINVLDGDINKLSGEINTTEGFITSANQDIAKTMQQIDQRTGYFNERLKNLYQEGNVSILEVLMKATSITDFITRFDLMSALAQNDVHMLKELDTSRQVLLIKKLALEEKVDQFNSLKGQKENKQQQMEIQSRQKNIMLKSIQEQKEEYIKAIDELEEVQQELDAFIKELQKKHYVAYMGSGKMGWPVPGYSRISSAFGYRIHPIFRVRRLHSAIDIPAPKGTPIRASETGKVIYKGYKGGYGNAIILDHGGNISTQYSHMDKFVANLGINDLVKKGDIIGYVGSTGWSTGPHLDFTVRVSGVPKNPTLYVKP